MIKHTQTIRRLLPTNCLSVFDHFVGLAVKQLNLKSNNIEVINNARKAHLFNSKKSWVKKNDKAFHVTMGA